MNSLQGNPIHYSRRRYEKSSYWFVRSFIDGHHSFVSKVRKTSGQPEQSRDDRNDRDRRRWYRYYDHAIKCFDGEC